MHNLYWLQYDGVRTTRFLNPNTDIVPEHVVEDLTVRFNADVCIKRLTVPLEGVKDGFTLKSLEKKANYGIIEPGSAFIACFSELDSFHSLQDWCDSMLYMITTIHKSLHAILLRSGPESSRGREKWTVMNEWFLVNKHNSDEFLCTLVTWDKILDEKLLESTYSAERITEIRAKYLANYDAGDDPIRNINTTSENYSVKLRQSIFYGRLDKAKQIADGTTAAKEKLRPQTPQPPQPPHVPFRNQPYVKYPANVQSTIVLPSSSGSGASSVASSGARSGASVLQNTKISKKRKQDQVSGQQQQV